jgi:HD-like signal output (HDOD) protein
VGIAAVLIALAESSAKKAPELLAIWPSVERVHPAAARKMAQLWQLPADIALAIGAHHQVKIEGHAHPLAATVCLADQLAHEHGFGLAANATDEDALAQACMASHTGIDRSGRATLASAREALRLTDKQLELLAGDAAKLEMAD